MSAKSSRPIHMLLLLVFLFGTTASTIGCRIGGDLQGPTDETPVDDPTDPGDDPTDPGDDPDPVPATDTVILEWDAPAANADGTPLTDLAGYLLCRGTTAMSISECVNVGLALRHEIELPFGTYYMGVKAYDIWGNEGAFSNILEVTLNPPVARGDAAGDDDAPDTAVGSLQVLSARAAR